MKLSGAWGLFGSKVFDDGREGVLLQSREVPPRWAIAVVSKNGNDGAWMYRSGDAAAMAFDAWDGKTPPMAGEWRDF